MLGIKESFPQGQDPKGMMVSGLDIFLTALLSSFQIPRAVGQGDPGPSGPPAALRQARDTPVER